MRAAWKPGGDGPGKTLVPVGPAAGGGAPGDTGGPVSTH